MIPLIVVGILVSLGGVGLAVSIYNSLVQVRNNVGKAWKNIDVLLQQRHDELVKLVDAVRGYVEHERDVLDAVTRLRVGYERAGTPDEKVRIENELRGQERRLRQVWEAYPDLKASQNFLQLQERISALESDIADRREFFNDSVNVYNIQIERFPDVLLAGMLRYARHEFLEVPAGKKEDVKIAVA